MDKQLTHLRVKSLQCLAANGGGGDRLTASKYNFGLTCNFVKTINNDILIAYKRMICYYCDMMHHKKDRLLMKFCSRNIKNKPAFTLAEVLITLGIIGVVAALTIPVLVGNYQKNVLKNQFKKTYATLTQAWTMTVATLGYEPECYYWEGSPYPGAHCSSYNSSGDCSKYQMPDGSPLPSDYNGRFGDCAVFAHEVLKNLNVIKTCQNNALSNGCIPEYEGNDSIYKKGHDTASDVDVNKATTGCGNWRKSAIATRDSAHVLADGQIILGYGYFSANIFAVDVNGKKGPNKWGHDLFGFQTIGNITRPLHVGSTGCMPLEQGGTYSSTMVQNFSAAK